ncbi:predicted protein [Lichtheimia corymbifera JMRC:FSU:9682]|uniref:F-box domain-containing protein n=1 Tax=Lichtheimia corymbifera JMRC:FSU:9682 TaxID=1263082 RepID=A0A068SFC6_9FUNG|nr:predicted protein [Lichtheimia corymbifera JMRC:FSU:9682]
MTHPALCKQPTLTASSEKYAKLVYDSTIQLHQSLQPILSALNRRAIGFTKCASFESALDDAKLIQQLSPYSALGYLCEATIYSEQGKQLQVIDVCNKGLSMADTMDTHYATLLQVKMDAKKRQDACIDFISQLPNEIIISTLIPMIMDGNLLDTATACPYLQVSHVWSDRIIQCFNGLRFTLNEDNDMSQVIRFAQHTRSLHVPHCYQGTWLGDLIGGNAFSSLQQISIGNFSSPHIEHFLSSLQSVSSTLTEFEMDMEDGPGFRVPDVMMACRNLDSLKISEALDGDVTSTHMTTWPTLTTLALTSLRHPITCDEIIDIWERFPALKKLTLSPCRDIQSTLIIPEHFPSMNRVDVWVDDSIIELAFMDEGNHGDGITKVVMWTSEFDACKDTTSIIKQHHSTLEHIEWDVHTRWDTENIDGLQFPRLKVLRIGFSGWQIPRNAPMLEELKLTWRIIRIHPEVLDIIPPRLTKLKLQLDNDDEGAVPVDTSAIEHYLDRIAIQQQLLELVIDFDVEQQIIEALLEAIYHHHQLECLKISFTEDLDPYNMEIFLDGLVKSCPRLACLELECANELSIHAINTLKQLEYLTQLRFPIVNADDPDRFWNAIRTFTQLKYVTIYPARDVQDQHVKYLKQHRPDMKIDVEGITIDLLGFRL